jgi:sortase A
MKNTYFYKKAQRRNIKRIFRFFGLVLLLSGFILGTYMFFPLISWQLYIKPVFANQSFTSPIPKKTIITKDYLRSLIQATADSFRGFDYTNNHSWLPNAYQEMQVTTELASYSLAIPKLNIENAIVSATDNDLSQHLVHFPGTTLPPNKGNGVIFGHSTLPQLYDPKNYKTIFANAHTLKVNDTILVTVGNTLYTYKIFNISIVDAEDTSYLSQEYDDSYLTIVTCTPPGTIWKRLVIKTRLEKN